ncbi:MAG TPA: AbrB/MazE/SpoVT family DNA-binding domain-containing protein [Pseudomonadota bacterium]|nr:AbrB/MazE/SpoVT family DNA-binding domain-containing protein [Pseudomonadota bacterium]
MCTNIKKWGNSLAIRLPKSITDKLRLTEASLVTLTIEEGKIVITRAQETPDLLKLVAAITPDNLHPETDWGPPAGKEVP